MERQPEHLWHFAISHFAEKARWALDYKQVPHTRELLFLDYPIRTYLKTRQLGLPILFTAGKPIVDSTEIIAHLEERYPAIPLYPSDPALRARALELEDFFDEELGPHIRALLVHELFAAGSSASVEAFGMGQSDVVKRVMRLSFPGFRRFYRYRHGMLGDFVAVARVKLEQALDRLEAEIGPSGYLVGDQFSVADLTAASLFYPIAFPPEYPYEIPDVSLEALHDLRAPIQERPARAWVERMYRVHRGEYESSAPSEARGPQSQPS